MEPSASAGELGDIAPPVAVEIDGGAQEGRGHELRMAEGARPGAVELLRRDVAAVEDLQRGDELAAEIVVAATRLAGERRQRLHDAALAEILAEIRFDAPHRDHCRRIDAIALLGRLQRAGVAAHQRAALLDALLVDEAGEIIPDRRLELGLLVHEARGVIGLEPARRAGDRARGDARRRRGMAQAGEAGGEIGSRRRGAEQRGEDREERRVVFMSECLAADW